VSQTQAHNAPIEHLAANRCPSPYPHKPFVMCSLRIAAALPTILLELPVSVVERADLASLEPSRNAVEVECVLQRRVSRAAAGLGMPQLRTLQIPQATVHSSLVAEAWFAWHSMPI
jgi:hypothetical protein